MNKISHKYPPGYDLAEHVDAEDYKMVHGDNDVAWHRCLSGDHAYMGDVVLLDDGRWATMWREVSHRGGSTVWVQFADGVQEVVEGVARTANSQEATAFADVGGFIEEERPSMSSAVFKYTFRAPKRPRDIIEDRIPAGDFVSFLPNPDDPLGIDAYIVHQAMPPEDAKVTRHFLIITTGMTIGENIDVGKARFLGSVRQGATIAHLLEVTDAIL